MRQCSSVVLLLTLTMTLGPAGCATVKTMPTLGSYGTPKIYSGTRLDVNAVSGDKEGLGKFSMEAPAYPLIDVPFSLLVDTFILPITISVALYEIVIE